MIFQYTDACGTIPWIIGSRTALIFPSATEQLPAEFQAVSLPRLP